MPLNEASTLAQSQNAPASDSFQMQQDYRKKLYTFPAGLPVPIRVAKVIFMKDWKSLLPTLIDRADKLSDNVRSRLRKITGFNNPLIIIPYLGYGTADKLVFGGRVLEDEGFTPAASADRSWRNLINMYKRFESDEVPGARIRAHFQGIESEATTDEEGYFSFAIQPIRRLDSNQWQEVELELLDTVIAPKTPPVRATARGAGAFRSRQIWYHQRHRRYRYIEQCRQQIENDTDGDSVQRAYP